MRIILLYPLLSQKRAKVDENKQFWPPLGLAYLAAVLERAGHEARIIDRDILLRKTGMDFTRTDDETIGEIKDFKPDMIGISATTPNMLDVGSISKRIKSSGINVPIILGGPHATAIPEETLGEFNDIDTVAIGEGEATIIDIANGVSPENIPGIAFRKGHGVVTTGPRKHIENLDDLPFPARHLLDMEFYLRPSRFTSRNLSLRTTSIFTARGCPYRCTFCAGPVIFPGKVRFHSTKRVITEIDHLVDKYNVEALYFAEDMFLSSKERALELLEEFKKRPWGGRLKWFAQARANLIDRDMLKLMKEAGCVGVEYGFESGSQRVLTLMNKRSTVEENLRAASLTREARMRFQANIIVGYPGETREDFEETIKFLRRVKPSNVGFNIFMPLPGTEIYKKLKADNRPIPPWEEIGDPELSSVAYAAMSKEDFERLYLTARFKVILPINLKNFIRDNIKNPLRLIRLLATQFWGTGRKTLRAFFRLKALSKNDSKKEKRALFVSYNAATEPIVKSQVLPYLGSLCRNGIKFFLLTFEKKDGGQKDLSDMLKRDDIEWAHLRFHKGSSLFWKAFDIIAGFFAVLRLCITKKINIVHARGVMAAAMSIVPSKMVGARFIFDMKSSLAEAYRLSGKIEEGSFYYKTLLFLEKVCILHSDEIIVETETHKRLTEKLISSRKKKASITVLPCCVETERFERDVTGRENNAGIKRLVYLGSLSGWYMLDEMLEFFRIMKERDGASEFLFLSNNDTTELARMIDSKKLDGVRIVKAAYGDVPSYLAGATAGILFKMPGERLDSFPIKVGEYLASGIPVIVNKGMGDVETMVKDGRVGIVVESFDRNGYSKAIDELDGLYSDKKEVAQRCREMAARRLSSSFGRASYESIYSRL